MRKSRYPSRRPVPPAGRIKGPRVEANDFVASVVRFFEPCGPQPPAAEARKRAPQAAPDISLNHCSAFSAAFPIAIAPQPCCGLPRPCERSLGERRREWRVFLFVSVHGRSLLWWHLVFHGQDGVSALFVSRCPLGSARRALRPASAGVAAESGCTAGRRFFRR